MMASWNREDLPYDAMGDFSTFEFEGTEDHTMRWVISVHSNLKERRRHPAHRTIMPVK